MIFVQDGASPFAYLDALFFWDTVSNGARTGTAVANNALFDLHRQDEVGGLVPLNVYTALNGPATIVDVKVMITTPFNAAGQSLLLGRGGSTAQFQAFGTDALIQPAVAGVKDMAAALGNTNVFLTANLLPKMRLTYSTAPTAGEGRVIFTLA